MLYGTPINPLYFDEFFYEPKKRKQKIRAYGCTKSKYNFNRVKAKRKQSKLSQRRNRK